MRVVVQGRLEGRKTEVIYDVLDYGDNGPVFTAMQRTTVFQPRSCWRLLAQGGVPESGVVSVEKAVDGRSCSPHTRTRNPRQRILPAEGFPMKGYPSSKRRPTPGGVAATLLTENGSAMPSMAACLKTGTRPRARSFLSIPNRGAGRGPRRARGGRGVRSWRLVPVAKRGELSCSSDASSGSAQGTSGAGDDPRDGKSPGRNARRRAGGDRHGSLFRRRRAPVFSGRPRPPSWPINLPCPCACPWRLRARDALEFSHGHSVLENVPALLCGNTVILKPSVLTPDSAFHFVEALEEAGVPPGVMNLVFGEGKNRRAG